MSTPRHPEISVRRIRSDEWAKVKALRLESTADPDAPIAFLESHDEVARQPDAFWKERAERGADSEVAAQFIAVAADGGNPQEWVASLSCLIRATGQSDHLGRIVDDRRAFVVGVYVRPTHRGSGAVDLLLTAAAEWAASQGIDRLYLDVHRDNPRAQGAYRRAGFVPTGESLTGPIGPEIVMSRPLP